MRPVSIIGIGSTPFGRHKETPLETLAVSAALSGDRKTALRALSCNPITADLDQAAPCLNEMIEQNRSLLPRFFPAH